LLRSPTPEDVHSARDLFGLDADADREDIVNAWKDALRLTHPDLSGARTRGMAEQLSKRVNQAKDVLLADWGTRVDSTARSATNGVEVPVGSTGPRQPDDVGWWGTPEGAPKRT
jgi:curved DNA-binding protein CbpA